MADLTKIVPSKITSNHTVAEVNGISLTKSKQNGESTFPTSTFAEILEAQLSQNNLQTVDSPTDSKQILPGQSVDPSLFGSLIVVVRDVEVPISENYDTPTTNENSRLFIPTVFTASTSSVVSVNQLPNQQSNEVANRSVRSNTSSDILTDVTSNKTLERPFDELPIADIFQSVSASPQVTTVSSKTTLVENSNETSNETKIVDPDFPAQNSVIVPLNNFVVQQPIVANTTNVDRDTETVTSIESSISQQIPKVSTNRNQIKENYSPNLQVSDNNQANTNPIQTLNPVSVESISNSPQTTIERNTEQVKSTQQSTETSPRTLSSMLQSVQGLKMGIERSPTHQTFITVALPISEVQRLVVANPEVFTANQTAENIDTNKNNEESGIVPKSTKINEGTINNSDKVGSITVENTKPIEQTISTLAQAQNREDLFVPTTFVSQNYSDTSQTNKQPQKTEVTNLKTIRPDVLPPKQETSRISSSIIPNPQQNDTFQSNGEVEFESVKLVRNEIQDEPPTPFRLTENTSVNENVIVPEQKSIESIAKVIENFATNLQTISAPIVSGTNKQNSHPSENQSKETVEFPFQAKIETISEKNTLVLEPVQKESVAQFNKKVDQVIESKHTISHILQKAEAEGITIESIVVKIPVQSSKNSEVQKESIVTSFQQPLASTITNETPILSQSTIVPNEEKEVGNVTIQSSPTKVTQNGKEVQSQNFQTPVQNDKLINLSKNVIESRPAESTISKSPSFQNEGTSLNRIGKEGNAFQTETNTNPKSDTGNLSSRRDVSTILQRVENIQQKSALIEEKNLVSITDSIDSTTSVPVVVVPKTTTPFLSPTVETTPSVEVTPKQPIETKEAIVLEDSSEKEVSNQTVSNTITSMAPAIKATSSMIPTPEARVIEVPVTIEELPDAIVQEFVTDTSAKGTKATFTLNPEQLGKVQVEVNVQGNNASITLESSHKETIPMLEKQIDTLKEQLKSSNIIVEKLEVLFKPAEIVQPTTTMNDTFTSSQQMEQQSMKQEIDREAQQQRQNNHKEHSVESENSVDEIQPKRFGDGSSIIEEYI
jgi:hypothetical protein